MTAACPNGHATVPGHRFCRVCGEPLVRSCPAGHPAVDDSRFCRTCGASMPAAVPAPPPAQLTPAGPATTVIPPVPPRPPAPSSTAAMPATTVIPSVPPPGGQPAPRPIESVGRTAPPRRHRTAILVGVLALLVAGGAVGGILAASGGHSAKRTTTLTSPSSRLSATPTTANVPAATTLPTSTSTSSPPTTVATPTTIANPRTAAASVASLLAQSVADRDAILNAVSDVSNCGGGLAEDVTTFRAAATSRATLIGDLAALSGARTLPPDLVADLHSAWAASEAADQDFATWAGDEASGGCTQNDHNDPAYNAATVPDDQATAAKTAFVQVWNPIATRYGLPTYSWQDL